jgi:hypothetical protein
LLVCWFAVNPNEVPPSHLTSNDDAKAVGFNGRPRMNQREYYPAAMSDWIAAM